MKNREKEVIDTIKSLTTVEVPEKLQPENIEKLLMNKRRRNSKLSYLYGMVAACFALTFVGGAYYVSDQQSAVGPDVAAEESKVANSYEEIYDYLARYQENIDIIYNVDSDEDIQLEADTADQTVTPEYSNTNTREKDVGEGDIVKTDGKYLYIIASNALQIVDTTSGSMKEKGRLALPSGRTIEEFYLQDTKMIIIYRQGSLYATASKANTEVVVYDAVDPTDIKEVGRMSQSGNYQTSRLVGDYLYIFSEYQVNVKNKSKKAYETYIPSVNDAPVLEENILIPPIESADKYTVISSIHIDTPNQVIDNKAILSNTSLLYVSGQNIYVTEQLYEVEAEFVQTAIQKIAYLDGELTKAASGKVYGYLEDSFSIDEHEGYLRVVTTVDRINGFHLSDSANDRTNALYVLDKQLEVVGEIEGLAQEERVYSARLIGDIGYFVTFKDIDPLFSVDLSDPKHPRILGELKIPGFSEYLHPYQEGQLLGIGMEVDERTGQEKGVKLSMFNIQNPKDVKEIDKYILPTAWSSDAFYDYKTVMISGERNIIGFSVRSDDRGYAGSYQVFAYEEGKDKGFIHRLTIDVPSGKDPGLMRGIYIDDRLYIIDETSIHAYDLNTYEKEDRLILS